MKGLPIPFLSEINKDSDATMIRLQLEKVKEHSIDVESWPGYSNKPDVIFRIAYSSNCLFLQYKVTESETRVTFQQSNEPVYKDSCVEFFIAFGEEKAYYNFEFNLLGTCLASFGEGREDRKFQSAATIEKIRYYTFLTASNDAGVRLINWELILAIPNDVFSFHSFKTLRGRTGSANFYKCGDDLQSPHYLSWMPISSEKPDFHLRKFFGAVQFE
jgi:hypothetical protein